MPTRLPLLLLPLLVLVACDDGPDEVPPADDDDDSAAVEPPSIDLTVALGPDEARAGVLGDEHEGAFVGGLAAESQPGDILLYNDRVRFVLQGWREGDNHLRLPGTLVDADLVRPPDQAGRDGLDEFTLLFNTGRVLTPDTLEVIADGTDGGPAVVRATGVDGPFQLLEGVLENPGLFPALDLLVEHIWTLEPGTELLRLDTTVTYDGGGELEFRFVDAGIRNLSTFDDFVPGVGVNGDVPDEGRDLLPMISRRNDVTLGLFPSDGVFAGEGALSLVNDMLGLSVGMGPEVVLATGESTTYTRYLGVARDLATLEIRRREIQDREQATVQGVLTEEGSGEPIEGARVFLTDETGQPLTLAVTAADGSYAITWDAGAAQLVAVGDGYNEQVPLPAGAGQYSSLAHPSANALALRAWSDPDDATPVVQSDGRGRSEPVAVALVDGEAVEQDLELPATGILRLQTVDEAGDPLPALVYVKFPDDDPQPADGRLGERRPGGARKAVWVLGEPVDVPLPAGTWNLQAVRGYRYELASEDGVEVTIGQTTEVTLSLTQAYDTPGWASADPHVHGPSNDGRTSMEERAASAAVNDLQLHIATEHDLIADYTEVYEAMEITPWVRSVPSVEVSTVMRGHFNIYPATVDTTLAGNGTPLWWEQQVTTSELFDQFRGIVGETGMVQVNHGRSPGMFTFAGYDPDECEVGDPDFYDVPDAMEILNGGSYGDAEELIADWCCHLDQGHRVVGTGVSDTHSMLPGPGNTRTWVHDDATDLDSFFAAFRAGQAVISSGPFVLAEASDGEGNTAGVGETLVADTPTLHVEVYAPSWMDVDEVRLYAGCELIDTWTADGTPPLVFEIDTPVEPGTYLLVEAEGDASLSPVWSGGHAWALTNPIWLESP